MRAITPDPPGARRAALPAAIRERAPAMVASFDAGSVPATMAFFRIPAAIDGAELRAVDPRGDSRELLLFAGG